MNTDIYDYRSKLIKRVQAHVVGVDPIELSKLTTETLRLLCGWYDDLMEDIADMLKGDS